MARRRQPKYETQHGRVRGRRPLACAGPAAAGEKAGILLRDEVARAQLGRLAWPGRMLKAASIEKTNIMK